MMRAAFSILAAALAGCGIGTIVPNERHTVRKHPLPPFELHEDCVRMQPGDRLEYRFQATARVNFDIHFHEGKVVVAPITREQVEADRGAFEPLDAHEYCLTWEARLPNTLVDYEVMLVRPAKR
jgi:hypothetical protein